MPTEHPEPPTNAVPTPQQRAQPKTLVYQNERIAVRWTPTYCIHSTKCVQGAPGVFRPSERPWIDLSGATDEQIVETIGRCPSGALHVEWLDRMTQVADTPTTAQSATDDESITAPAHEPPTADEQYTATDAINITPSANGPLLVRGHVRIVAPDGALIREDTRMALCRCGQSSNKPFCDGTHRTVGFQSEAQA